MTPAIFQAESLAVAPPEPAPSAHADRLPSHIPVLDGIRGLAILLVMFLHFTVMKPVTAFDRAWMSVTEYGWIGVDLFFVLSGFLITGILYESRSAEHYFRNFYARRTVRIFPLYYAVAFFALVVIPLIPIASINRFGPLHGHQAWYWLYLSNFHQAYVGQFTHPIMSVTWSLAIEEQFYLIWPTVVFFLPRKWLIRLCLGMILAAVATRAGVLWWLAHSQATNGLAVYMLTPCRMDGLATGALIALAVRRPGGLATMASWAKIALPVCAAAVGILIVFSGGDWDESVFFTLLAVMFGSMLVLGVAARPGTLLSRFFGSGFMRMFGRYSYALYLFHYPITMILRDSVYKPARFFTIAGSPLPGQVIFYIVATAVSLGAALLSWNLYEKHFLKLKDYFPSGSHSGTGTSAGAGRIAAGK